MDKEPKQNNRIGSNTIYNTIKTVFGIIFPLITFPYISRVLGVENIGKINYGLSVVNYFSLIASLGITTYAIRECSKVRENKSELSNTASQILSINIVTTIISYLLLFITLAFATRLEAYRGLILLQSVSILFVTLGADWLNMAMEDFRYITIRTVFVQFISLLLMFLFVKRPEDYVKYAIITVIANSGANAVNVLYRRKFCMTRFTMDIDWKRHLVPIFTLFSMMVFQTVITNADTTMLGFIKGDTQVGLYSTSLRIYNLVNQVVAAIAWVVMPQLSASFAQKDYAEVNKVLKYVLSHTFVLGVPSIVGLNAITEPLIEVFAGKEFIAASTSLHIFTISLALSFAGGFFGNMILLPSGREKHFMIACIVTAVVNVILNLIAIPRWGLNGAAFTTVISDMVCLFLIVPKIEKDIKINGMFEVVKAPIVGGLAIVMICECTKVFIKNSIILVVVSIGLSGLIYALILILLKNHYFLQAVWRITHRNRNNT